MTTNPSKSEHSKPAAPADVRLLLRAHAESHWLDREVLPVLRELERGQLRSQEQICAAVSYLEALWIEACGRAAETDATRVELDDRWASGEEALYEKAHRYHAAVRRMRSSVAARVQLLLASSNGDTAPQLLTDRRASS